MFRFWFLFFVVNIILCIGCVSFGVGYWVSFEKSDGECL